MVGRVVCSGTYVADDDDDDDEAQSSPREKHRPTTKQANDNKSVRPSVRTEPRGLLAVATGAAGAQVRRRSGRGV